MNDKEYDVNCPFCRNKGVLHEDSSIIYKQNYGPIYLCECYPQCQSWIGCHPGTIKPLGFYLANEEVRRWKNKAHKEFDVLWKKGIMGRSESYGLMAKLMNLPGEQAHIGMFDVYKCKKLIREVKKYKKKIGLNI